MPRIISTNIIINVEKVWLTSPSILIWYILLKLQIFLELEKQLLKILNTFIVCKHGRSVFSLWLLTYSAISPFISAAISSTRVSISLRLSLIPFYEESLRFYDGYLLPFQEQIKYQGLHLRLHHPEKLLKHSILHNV